MRSRTGWFVDRALREARGRAPTRAEADDLSSRLGAGSVTRPALVADLVQPTEAIRRFAARVDVLMT